MREKGEEKDRWLGIGEVCPIETAYKEMIVI